MDALTQLKDRVLILEKDKLNDKQKIKMLENQLKNTQNLLKIYQKSVLDEKNLDSSSNGTNCEENYNDTLSERLAEFFQENYLDDIKDTRDLLNDDSLANILKTCDEKKSSRSDLALDIVDKLKGREIPFIVGKVYYN